jgi:hypothetical protein
VEFSDMDKGEKSAPMGQKSPSKDEGEKTDYYNEDEGCYNEGCNL